MQQKNAENQDVEVVGMELGTGTGKGPVGSMNPDSGRGALLETVSSLMDGEASQLELRRILKTLADTTNNESVVVLDTWSRFHLISASLKQEIHSNPAVNLLPGIYAKLMADEQPLARRPYQRKLGNLMRKLGQTAVAASVAFTVLYGASRIEMTLRDESGTSSEQIAVNVNTADMPELGGSFTPSDLSRTVSVDAAARDRIQRAVQQFSGTSPPSFGGEAYSFPVHQEHTPELSEQIPQTQAQ